MSDSGIVARRTKGFYYLITDDGRELECKVKGMLYKDSRFDNQIAVGDRVVFIKAPADDVGLITGIEKRKSFLSRNRVGVEAEQIIAANIDYLFIVASAKAPPFRTNLVNRLIVAATIGNITPLLVLTKTDLANGPCIEQLLEPYRSIQLEIVQTSIKNDAVDPRLMHLLSTGTSVLSGQSGVGKSSLLNTYFPDLRIKVGAVSSKTAKGSHTTTYANLHRIGKTGFVIDTPGIREFGLWGIRRENLGWHYPLIDEIRGGCKHRNCHHIHEPGCAVKTAVVDGIIHQSLYQGYCSIYESLSR